MGVDYSFKSKIIAVTPHKAHQGLVPAVALQRPGEIAGKISSERAKDKFPPAFP